MRKILLVEDDPFLVKVYGKLLEKEGFSTFILETGEGVADLAKKEGIDLIVLDMVLPKKDGFDVLADLKKDDAVRNVPVLVLTMLGMQEDIDKTAGFGVAKHLVKTKVGFKEVVGEIKKLLE